MRNVTVTCSLVKIGVTTSGVQVHWICNRPRMMAPIVLPGIPIFLAIIERKIGKKLGSPVPNLNPKEKYFLKEEPMV